MKTGMVYLVGAGPGDPELITVKGKSIMKQANCIVYDRLASPELLAYAKEDCEMIYVGKENHHHTMKQEDINELLYQKALKYEHVVRLKGGDVYVFGRGGEEGIYLEERKIPFEVVPGISSALAGPAYAGIPITHRGVAMGFHVVTAHNKRDELANIDFEAMARGEDTCVFLMGLSKLSEIVENLLAAGMKEEKPVAVISHATMDEQKTVVGTLTTIGEKVRIAGLTSPALIVVGDVVKLREHLNYQKLNQDLVNNEEGRRILVPRIGTDPSELVAGLKRAGNHVDEIQVGEIVTRQNVFTRTDIEEAKWIVFTSKHGVDSFFSEVKRMKMDYRIFAGKHFAVVGSKTEARLEEKGFYADLIPEKYRGDDLCEMLRIHTNSEDVVLYGMAASELHKEKNKLTKLENKCKVRKIALYENEVRNQNEKITSDYDCICFSSASSVQRLWKMLDHQMQKKMIQGEIRSISIGIKTSEALLECGVQNYKEAAVSTYQGMLELF